MSAAVAPLAVELSPAHIDAEPTRTPMTVVADSTPATVIEFPDLTIDLRECEDITITELVQQEAELAYANWLGELHPHHAARLRQVAAELDRRWAEFV